MPTQSERKQPGTLVERDNEGFLLYPEDWSLDLAYTLAEEGELVLEGETREVVMFIRNYFEQNHSVPEARRVLKFMEEAWGKERATRKHLYHLFPRGYGQQACKIAGMRKPLKLMLDI